MEQRALKAEEKYNRLRSVILNVMVDEALALDLHSEVEAARNLGILESLDVPKEFCVNLLVLTEAKAAELENAFVAWLKTECGRNAPH
jgi:hypothetical protein